MFIFCLEVVWENFLYHLEIFCWSFRRHHSPISSIWKWSHVCLIVTAQLKYLGNLHTFTFILSSILKKSISLTSYTNECKGMLVLKFMYLQRPHVGKPFFTFGWKVWIHVIFTGSDDDETFWDRGIDEFIERVRALVSIKHLSWLNLTFVRVEDDYM